LRNFRFSELNTLSIDQLNVFKQLDCQGSQQSCSLMTWYQIKLGIDQQMADFLHRKPDGIPRYDSQCLSDIYTAKCAQANPPSSQYQMKLPFKYSVVSEPTEFRSIPLNNNSRVQAFVSSRPCKHSEIMPKTDAEGMLPTMFEVE
jgi:hypothetical protein